MTTCWWWSCVLLCYIRRFTVNATLVIVSCAFLLTTLCVYICLPTLQNLHGKTLMSHVGSLLMAYVSLALVSIASPPLESEYSDTLTFCTFLGKKKIRRRKIFYNIISVLNFLYFTNRILDAILLSFDVFLVERNVLRYLVEIWVRNIY